MFNQTKKCDFCDQVYDQTFTRPLPESPTIVMTYCTSCLLVENIEEIDLLKRNQYSLTIANQRLQGELEQLREAAEAMRQAGLKLDYEYRREMEKRQQESDRQYASLLSEFTNWMEEQKTCQK